MLHTRQYIEQEMRIHLGPQALPFGSAQGFSKLQILTDQPNAIHQIFALAIQRLDALEFSPLLTSFSPILSQGPHRCSKEQADADGPKHPNNPARWVQSHEQNTCANGNASPHPDSLHFPEPRPQISSGRQDADSSSSSRRKENQKEEIGLRLRQHAANLISTQ